MKVQIEIKDKYINLASSILMTQADTEKEEKQLEETVSGMKASEAPIIIDLNEIDDEKVKSYLPMALASFAISQELSRTK